MIREATIADLPWLMHAAERYHFLCNYGEISPFNFEAVMECFKAAIESDMAQLFVAESCGELCGCILVALKSMVFTSNLIATEYIWYTDDELCRSSVAVRLYLKAEKWAADNGATHMMMSTMQGYKEAETISFYQKIGYDPKPKEQLFFKEL